MYIKFITLSYRTQSISQIKNCLQPTVHFSHTTTIITTTNANILSVRVIFQGHSSFPKRSVLQLNGQH